MARETQHKDNTSAAHITIHPVQSAVAGQIRLREARLSGQSEQTHTSRYPLTSTSFIKGTGLKKWSPANRSCLVVAFAMLVICKEEVLLAKTVCLWRERQWSCRMSQDSFFVNRTTLGYNAQGNCFLPSSAMLTRGGRQRKHTEKKKTG